MYIIICVGDMYIIYYIYIHIMYNIKPYKHWNLSFGGHTLYNTYKQVELAFMEYGCVWLMLGHVHLPSMIQHTSAGRAKLGHRDFFSARESVRQRDLERITQNVTSPYFTTIPKLSQSEIKTQKHPLTTEHLCSARKLME